MVALWALREQPLDGLNGLCAELQKDDKPFVTTAEAAAELLRRIEGVKHNAAQLDELWNDRATNFATELADRTRYRHIVNRPRRPTSPGKFLVEDKWSEQERVEALQKLKKSEIRKLATELGVDEDELDDAYDAPDIQAALIDIVVSREAKQHSAAADLVDNLPVSSKPVDGIGIGSEPVPAILEVTGELSYRRPLPTLPVSGKNAFESVAHPFDGPLRHACFRARFVSCAVTARLKLVLRCYII